MASVLCQSSQLGREYYGDFVAAAMPQNSVCALRITEPIDRVQRAICPAAGSDVLLRVLTQQVTRAGSSQGRNHTNMCSDGCWRSLMECQHLSGSAADETT